MPTATGVSVAELQLIIHHVFLTPGNPQSGDDIELALASEVALLNYVCQALRDFGNLEVLNGNGAVQRAREAIQFLRDSKISSGDLDAQKLQKAFETLSKEGTYFNHRRDRPRLIRFQVACFRFMCKHKMQQSLPVATSRRSFSNSPSLHPRMKLQCERKGDLSDIFLARLYQFQ